MRNGVFSSFCKYLIVPLIKFFFIKEIRGWENFPTERNFILVSNHQSYLDLLIDGFLCVPKRFHFIGQVDGWKGISKFFIKGFYFLSGTIPVDRKNDKSREKTLQKAIEVLEKGDILIIYPEGKRSATGEIQEGKLGTAKIFLKTGVPILPVGIKGTFELMPPHGKLKIKKIIEVNIGKPIFFKKELEKLGNNQEEHFQIIKKITDEIMAKIANLTQELV